jgi:hypothetical protein
LTLRDHRGSSIALTFDSDGEPMIVLKGKKGTRIVGLAELK